VARLVGSLKWWLSFAKEPYKRDCILQKKPIIKRLGYSCKRLYYSCVARCLSLLSRESLYAEYSLFYRALLQKSPIKHTWVPYSCAPIFSHANYVRDSLIHAWHDVSLFSRMNKRVSYILQSLLQETLLFMRVTIYSFTTGLIYMWCTGAHLLIRMREYICVIERSRECLIYVTLLFMCGG